MAAKKKKPAAKPKKTKKAAAKPKAHEAVVVKNDPRQVAEAVLRALTITVVADAEVAEEEEQLLRRISAEPIFRDVDARAVIGSAVKKCLSDGVDASLSEISKQLGSKQARETAFTTCVAAAASDGRIRPSEARLLKKIRDAFGIAAARARSLAGPVAPALA